MFIKINIYFTTKMKKKNNKYKKKTCNRIMTK